MKREEGYAVMQIKVTKETRAALIMLAGGERKVGAYLDEIAPILVAAQQKIEQAQIDAHARELAISIVQSRE